MGDVIAFPSDDFETRGWKSPYTFVDKDDLLKDKRGAFVFFLDLLVHRPTEFKALIHLFLRAYSTHIDEIELALTPKQQKAVTLAFEAVANGERPTRYVAQGMGVGVRAALGLLHRADKRAKMFQFADLLTINNRDSVQSPLEDPQIRSWMYIHKRECAGSGRPATKVGGRPVVACEGHTIHNHSLCWPCMQVYGKVFGDWPEWVSFKVRDITREHRQNAIEALYRERKLVLMVDGDYELAIAA